jgi:hypothetical protein
VVGRARVGHGVRRAHVVFLQRRMGKAGRSGMKRNSKVGGGGRCWTEIGSKPGPCGAIRQTAILPIISANCRID